MASRLKLQSQLEELMENTNVYYQPPNNLNMTYPAIRYSRSNIATNYADDMKYKNLTRYELIVISKRPDHPVIEKLLELPYCSYERHYTADNLHHDVLTIYY